MVLLLVFMQLTRDLFAIAKFLYNTDVEGIKDTVEHIGEAVARPFGTTVVALLEALPHVEVAIVMRRKNKPLSQSFGMKALTKMQRTVGAEAERPPTVFWVQLFRS